MLRIIRKNKFVIGKLLILMYLCLAALLCTSCTEKERGDLPAIEDYDTMVAAVQKMDLRLGVVTGPYGDMFLETIQPLLAPKGYTVELVSYEDYIEPNFALANNVIDLNMFQHYRHLNSFKFEHDLALSAITEIPTASMGIYSFRYKSLDDLKDGATVSIPADTTNHSRALVVLDAAGIIKLNPSIDKSKATEKDIIENIKNIRFTSIQAQNLDKSLNGFDLSVINGNFALSGGLNLSDALYNEVLAEGYMNVIVVRTDDLNKQFVRDLIDAVNSDEFKDKITDADGKYSGFQYPRSFSKQTDN